MEQTCGSASAFERGMARGQDGTGDLSIALAETMGMRYSLRTGSDQNSPPSRSQWKLARPCP